MIRPAAIVVVLVLACWGMARGGNMGVTLQDRSAHKGTAPLSVSHPPIADPVPYVTPTEPTSRAYDPERPERSVTVEQWRAASRAAPDYATERWLLRTGWCEGHLDPTTRIIDVDGLPRVGSWSVGEQWWGPVPPDLEGQARQVANIVAKHGAWPWRATAQGCKEWSR